MIERKQVLIEMKRGRVSVLFSFLKLKLHRK
jgi:hypothetical protein